MDGKKIVVRTDEDWLVTKGLAQLVETYEGMLRDWLQHLRLD